jgi:hypothetical protein
MLEPRGVCGANIDETTSSVDQFRRKTTEEGPPATWRRKFTSNLCTEFLLLPPIYLLLHFSHLSRRLKCYLTHKHSFIQK